MGGRKSNIQTDIKIKRMRMWNWLTAVRARCSKRIFRWRQYTLGFDKAKDGVATIEEPILRLRRSIDHSLPPPFPVSCCTVALAWIQCSCLGGSFDKPNRQVYCFPSCRRHSSYWRNDYK
jgi:hypothetical protein